MNNTLDYIARKFRLDLSQKPPIVILEATRQVMAETLAELNFKAGAEIGVAQGHHARELCKRNPGLKLYCVDIWQPYPGYNEYQDRIVRYHREAQVRLAPFDCRFIQKFSMDAVDDFKDGSLDFVYIDGAHDFKNVAMDICEWSKKVRIGGIVFGHDYKRSFDRGYTIQVKDVVQAYMYSHEIRPWFVLETGRNASWMFVRQETDRI